MNELVREWLLKSEGDFKTAYREYGVQDYPNYDAVCFHAQQCVEKLMKAVLILHNVVPPKTHRLDVLSEQLQSLELGWEWPSPDLRLLDRASVQFRYPGESADYEDASMSIEVAGKLRDRLLDLLIA